MTREFLSYPGNDRVHKKWYAGRRDKGCGWWRVKVIVPGTALDVSGL